MDHKSNSYGDDFVKRRIIAKRCATEHLAEPWQFRVEVDDKSSMMTAKDSSHHCLFDYLAKDVSFGPVEIATEPVEAGAAVFTYPKSRQPVVITMTVRDTADRKLYDWFEGLAGAVVNNDGTFNLPYDYTFPLTILSYSTDQGSDEKVLWSGLVYATKMGDITMSVDGQGFLEFSITFQQFSSLGSIGEA